MILNDHLLKTSFGNILTGKISDVCGLFVFPLFLCTLYEVLLRRPLSRTVFYSNLIITNLIFIGLNTSEAFVQIYLLITDSIGIPSMVTMDWTDLLILPINFLILIYIDPWLRARPLGKPEY